MEVRGYKILTINEFETGYNVNNLQKTMDKLNIKIEDIFNELDDNTIMDETFTIVNIDNINQLQLNKKIIKWETIITNLNMHLTEYCKDVDDDYYDDDEKDENGKKKRRPQKGKQGNLAYRADVNYISYPIMHQAVVKVCNKCRKASMPFIKYKILILMIEYYLPFKQIYDERRSVAYNNQKIYQKNYLAMRVTCECGVKIARSNLSKHRNTSSHKERKHKLFLAGEYIPKPDEENQDCDDEE